MYAYIHRYFSHIFFRGIEGRPRLWETPMTAKMSMSPKQGCDQVTPTRLLVSLRKLLAMRVYANTSLSRNLESEFTQAW